ncbi:thioredoxin family protein [Rubrivirga sp. IMCC43871]|uniref:thioredoxin family protein n=1 Tax=Rubrivirga sp. IMCC43871 TaxID=3391575 RepID=UPI00398FCBBB
MTSHLATAADRSADWARALPFEPWLAAAEDLVELWTSAYDRARVSDDLVARVNAVPGTWKLLVISEDWCIDATTTVPPLARLAALADALELRVLDRDENLELMDEHLTNGRARSIPVAILLDPTGTERGWWGPRPADLQAWFEGPGQEVEKDDRYKELRRWYARDRGQSTLAEVVALVEAASGSGAVG